MKVETTILEDQQARLKVEVEADQLEAAKRRAARTISQRAKIPGFRPGKAPYNMVARYIGEEAILQEALESLVDQVYPQAIQEAKLKPYGPGRLENIPSKEPPVFEFVIPLDAEVTLSDYKSIRIPYEPKVITDKDVEKVLEDIREQQAVVEPVERPAWEGDELSVNLSAERKDVKEGENPVLIRERTVSIVIRPEASGDNEETGQEWPFPGFSRHLLGLSVGDEKTILYTFPEDSSFELFRGQEAEYKVKVEGVKSRTLPELNNNLAKSQGEFETLEALRAAIRERLEFSARREYDADYDEKIFTELLKETQIKYPPQMLEQEINNSLRQLENRLAQQKMDLETYLKTRKIDREALQKELTPISEQRMKRFLIIYDVARTEQVQVSPEEVQQETMRTMNAVTSGLSRKEARRIVTQESVTNLASNITVDKLVANTVERLRAIAKGEVVTTEPAPAIESSEPTSEQASSEAKVEPAPEASEPAEAVKPKRTRKKKEQT